MEFILNRFRNLTVLLIVIVAQLLMIAYQVKTNRDVPLLRLWAVTAVTPVERVLEVVRRNTWGFVEDYIVLINTRAQNEALNRKVGELKLENQYLRTELATADRAQALTVFQTHTPSKTLAARIVGNGTGANSKAVFVDRGSGSGVEGGMAVITPDGIVGKVVAAYPTASLVLLITDANFGAGVISQKNRVRGTLKGQGHDGTVRVDYIQNEEKVDQGEWFFTSGDDRIFPKGFPVGRATTVRNGRDAKEIYVSPSGFRNGIEEVLIVLEPVHQLIPDTDMTASNSRLLAPPPNTPGTSPEAGAPSWLTTDADRLRDEYRQAGDAQHHVFGEGAPGSTPPDFTKIIGLREPPPPPPTVTPTPTPTVSANNGAPAAAAAKTKPTAVPPATAAPVPTPAPVRSSVTAKPQPSAPLLITDPNDADPSETVVAAPPAKKAQELDEFGQPKNARPVKKPAIRPDVP